MAQKMKVDIKNIVAAASALRDVKNWLAVFKTEYGLSKEAHKVLDKKLEDLGRSLAGITCGTGGVERDSVRTVANALRDTKAWLAVFAKEYDIAKEAVNVLHGNLDTFGEKLASIKCK